MKILYFAWVREAVGLGEETVALPDTVQTVAELLSWLSAQSEAHASALAQSQTLRVAINQEHVDHAASLEGATEIAIFPPMTGG